MTRKEKRIALANKLSNLTNAIKRIQAHIDKLLDMQAQQYIETRDNILFKLLDLQVELNRQYNNVVIQFNNVVEVVEA